MIGNRRRLTDHRRVLLGHGVKIGNRVVDLIQTARLLLAGGGNVGNDVRDFLDRGDDVSETLAGRVDQLRSILNLGHAVLNQCLDFTRGGS
jgi:hypothetical protein